MDKKTNDVVLTCGIARDLLPLYLDGLTSPESAAALEAHLASCPDCRGSLWPSALFWPAATTRRIRRKRMNPCPWPPSNRSGGTCLCWWKARG